MKTVCIFLILSMSTFANAQDRIAYADVEYIFNQLPAAKRIESELKSLQTQLQGQLKARYEEYRKRVDYYTQREKDMTPAQLESARKELQALQDNFNKLEQDSDAKLQLKHKQLIEPVTMQIQKAIAEVAQQKGYDYILNAGAGQQDLILFASDEANVSDLVLEKLGVSPAAASQH